MACPLNRIFDIVGALSLLLLFCVLTPRFVFADHDVAARYLQIELPGNDRTLMLAEVQVYSGTQIISQGKQTWQSSTYRHAGPELAIDGNTSGDFFEGAVSATKTTTRVSWMLDLGANHAISRIIIYNRTDCCQERLNPARIALFDNDEVRVWQTTLNASKEKYDIPVAVANNDPSRMSLNLFRNATFLQQTNSNIPDYWGMHPAAKTEFQELYQQYRIANDVPAPVSGVNVLRLENSVAGFYQAAFVPHLQLADRLAPGRYSYSVYLKAEGINGLAALSPAWDTKESRRWHLTNKWRRYETEIEVTPENGTRIQPLLYFPKKGVYYIAAPQLEKGSKATPFRPAYGDGELLDETKAKVNTPADITAFQTDVTRDRGLDAYFEYDHYVDDDVARIRVGHIGADVTSVQLRCHLQGLQTEFFATSLSLPGTTEPLTMEVPIGGLAPGVYQCQITSSFHGSAHTALLLQFRKILRGTTDVRVDRFRRMLVVNGQRFQVIGIYVPTRDLPNWYLADLQSHGFNTLWLTAVAGSDGEYRVDEKRLRRIASRADAYGLKIMIGATLGGKRPVDWLRQLDGFTQLVERLNDVPNVIGWWPVDEPENASWHEENLLNVYSKIKNADPSRIVMINWGAQGVQSLTQAARPGLLGATDLYSLDYYPFTFPDRSLAGFTETTLRALLQSNVHSKVSHSFLQLMGERLAWREPTPDELNYMAYINLVFGGSISYFESRSVSKANWDKISVINRQARWLAGHLFQNEAAQLVARPYLCDGMLVSIWKEGANLYVIVVNIGNQEGGLMLDLGPYVDGAVIDHTGDVFKSRQIRTEGRKLLDRIAPLGTAVYEITLSRHEVMKN